MDKLTFSKEFLWGAATSSYQIEGAAKEDGRGLSIWDTFSHTLGKTINGDTGDAACDHYHKYREDVSMMVEIGLNSYLFSISWSRVFPHGEGAVNQKGIDFYNVLVDELIKNNIEPVAVLYHWDLPQALQDKGGWDNRNTIECFAEYAAFMFKSLGDRVKKWITFKEPWVVAFLGNLEGVHAPGFKDPTLAVRVSHNLMVSHAQAVQAFRQSGIRDGKISISLNLYPIYSFSESAEDKLAAKMADGYDNRWFLDPVLKGVYPEDMLEFFETKLDAPEIMPGDMDLIKNNPIDFLSVNYYSRELVKYSPHNNIFGYKAILPESSEVTDMGWEVYPEGLYDLLKRIHRDYEHPEIFITENGAAFKDDRIIDGRVEDDDRIEFVRGHLEAVSRAASEGVRVKGYYLWSLMDNFEWAWGYSKRFGIIYVDYTTLRRTLKKSAFWFKNLISKCNKNSNQSKK